jgi:hypothetical protein
MLVALVAAIPSLHAHVEPFRIVQPEVCSNVSEAPLHLYHRAREAKQCMLRAMYVMPLWMPEITKNAPMAVLEVLQPDAQADFEYLYHLVRFCCSYSGHSKRWPLCAPRQSGAVASDVAV